MTPTEPWSDILSFWFGNTDAEGGFTESRNALWWGKDPDVDAAIRERFGKRIDQASAGELDWAADPRGRLALVLLIDQMRRNAFRDTAEMYGADPVARALVLEGLEQGADVRLDPMQRVFFYLPLEHSEQLAHQQRCVELCEALAASVSAKRDVYANMVTYAIRHRDIVERFGRFPHRNAILGRSSTPEEVEFLQQPGSSF